MPKTKPVGTRRRGNPRPVSYPRVCYFRPHERDAEVLEDYCWATRQRASAVLRQILNDWLQQPHIRAVVAGTEKGKGVPSEQ